MANSDRFLDIARQGAEAWNQWRRDNPEETVDFSDVDFTLDENQRINFYGFDFGDYVQFDDAVFGVCPHNRETFTRAIRSLETLRRNP